jgi:hypothetical protein
MRGGDLVTNEAECNVNILDLSRSLDPCHGGLARQSSCGHWAERGESFESFNREHRVHFVAQIKVANLVGKLNGLIILAQLSGFPLRQLHASNAKSTNEFRFAYLLGMKSIKHVKE